MDKEYRFDIDDLDNIEVLPDTKRILTYLYTEFVAKGEERDLLKQIEKVQYEKYIENKRQNYKNIFEKETSKESKVVAEESLPMLKEKESFFKKIRKFVKRHLKR